ncbi:YALI0E25531p [Yarrowia lipolytica CLIB122]|uniref:YALI0E25531p n=1 Tax=Yarrowia lipolytica (strain CLIB 122 / E 150) TaxID=284591 RepID=Q6C4M4_YARLI|nr:YALI0E25531p [Yarrowia lipolytica CLIB122]CAG79988.1 YALI0E25531p [Yarrowia lipolytica CLIB122]|eukprot:XP_504388.1 YALI0E25531p [Yarrowia lipolytica CLIB122]
MELRKSKIGTKMYEL